MQHFGGLALFLGIALNAIAWLAYRKPDVPYLTFSTPWQMSKHLLPKGVMFYRAGCTIIVVAVVAAIVSGALEA